MHDAPASGDAGANAGTMHGMINAERQAGSSDGEMSAEHLATLLRQVSKTSIGEIDSLIAELKTLHKNSRPMATVFNAILRNTLN